ncbi:MAG: protein-export chaperone SecB [Rickettsiaceae bacterium]|nr:protein-export chaperone SecB [Rickettsiaceae bacterium]
MSTLLNEDDKKNTAHLAIQAQYIVDLSFENPRVPMSLVAINARPQVDLNLDIDIKNIEKEEDVFQVSLHINAKVTHENEVLYILDLVYAGLFKLSYIPKENYPIILAVEGPRHLFPFVRKIVADTTQNGGFQPLMIDPIDFGALYKKRMEEQEKTANH